MISLEALNKDLCIYFLIYIDFKLFFDSPDFLYIDYFIQVDFNILFDNFKYQNLEKYIMFQYFDARE